MRRLAIVLGLALFITAAVASAVTAQGVYDLPPVPGPWGVASGTAPKASDRAVTIEFASGGCINQRDYSVTPTADAVIITVRFSTLASPNGTTIPCPMAIKTLLTVDLGGPLGNRALEDGSTDPPAVRWPAGGGTSESLLTDYDALRSRDLPISFDRRFRLRSDALPAYRIASSERAGRKLIAHVEGAYHPFGSLAIPVGNPHHEVPDFRGKPLAAAARWAARYGLIWDAGRPARLRKATASHLLGNYRIRTQSPKPGAFLAVGEYDPTLQGFEPTPLALTVR